MEEKEETIWEELNRFIDSIHDEIRNDEPDMISIDFWLWKIKRRVRILKEQSETNSPCELL